MYIPYAFPSDVRNFDGSMQYQNPGMDLRDWFAGQALTGLTNKMKAAIPVQDLVQLSQEAYMIADAMLRYRETNQAR